MAKIQKTVYKLTRYFVKTTGSVVYRVRNGQDKIYTVTLNSNGTTGCLHNDHPCESSNYGRKCYHIKACQQFEEERGFQDANGRPLTRIVEEQSARELALAAARAASDQELARIDAEVQAQIAEEQAAPTAPKSEQARIADIEDDDPWEGLDDEEKYVAWRNYEMSIAG